MKRLVAFVVAALFAGVAVAAGYADISIAELKAAIANKSVTLLDANGTDSWQAGHIPGAIDFAAQQGKLADLLPKDKGALIVAYCGGPRCHAYQAAAAAAAQLGYTNIKHLSAGIHGWKNGGEATEKGD
ncbi:MAG: rhodanese-like domain-containing protein [Verrucomicrobia bacterium]|nr:MAG: rhodanese-like domain-containing protein [Verrucomicrobiota bacterium]